MREWPFPEGEEGGYLGDGHSVGRVARQYYDLPHLERLDLGDGAPAFVLHYPWKQPFYRTPVPSAERVRACGLGADRAPTCTDDLWIVPPDRRRTTSTRALFAHGPRIEHVVDRGEVRPATIAFE